MGEHRRWTVASLFLAVLAAASIAIWAELDPPGPRKIKEPKSRDKRSDSAMAPAPDGALRALCEDARRDLAEQLGEECHSIVRAPFVLAGDLSERDLAAWHRRTIAPAAEAIAAAYTSVKPDQPITILLFGNEESYRHYAQELFGDRDVSVYGYYKPSLRTMVMNISTGGGTLVHELTHALVDFDFPEIPDWFNEGLASLHEQCRFRPDGSGIDGLVNWRLPALQKAIAAGRLRPLEDLIGSDDFRGRLEGLNYGQARYFCMYMQNKRVLEKFYKAFRSNRKTDRVGLKTAKSMFPDASWAELNTDFRRWVARLRR